MGPLSAYCKRSDAHIRKMLLSIRKGRRFQYPGASARFLQVAAILIRIVGVGICPKITGQLYTRTVILGKAMGTRTFAKLTVNQGIGENFAAKAHAMLGRTSGCAFGVKLPKPIRGPAAMAPASTARSSVALHGQAGAGAG